jgi:uncharacterized membrane protein (UPF0182 family)
MRAIRGSGGSRRLRALVLTAFGVLLILFLSASGIANVYTDWLWFSGVELGSVWQTVVGTRVVLVIIFTTLFFVLLWGNLYLADRVAPVVRPDSPEEDLIERYHQMVGPYTGRIRFGVSALFALVAGVNTSKEWRTWLLFRNGEDFGWVDPLFGRDAGFYVFELPFWTFLIDWFFNSLVFALLVALIAHYLNGGIRASAAASERVSPGVKLHLSGLLAVLAVLRALAYWHDRYELVTSTRGVFDGALATDVEVQLPALNLLALISIFGALLFLINIRRRGWGLPLVAVGLWAISHVVIGGIYPALYQRLRIVPAQSSREAEFIAHNIDATRHAYGLDGGADGSELRTIDYGYEPELTVADIEAAQDILEDVALVDATLATEPFTRSQGEREYYAFSDRLDIDRYRVGDNVEPVVLAVRELNPGGIDNPSWEIEHLAYTHGLGVAVAAGDAVASDGQPLYFVEGVGPNQQIVEGFEAEVTTPQVYFGEGFGGYAVVGTKKNEIDYAGAAAGEVVFQYDGEGGVPVGSFLRRAAFSLRFQHFDLMLSGQIDSDSRIIYNRGIEDRVSQLAPFLDFDSDPYPVILDGRLIWVIDGYTTTSRFPYSQSVSGRAVGADADLGSGYNYVRNSVKAVVDGYDGSVSFYVIDESDPMIAAWSKAFPDLFSSVDELPDGLEEHFRYPVDIFKVQTDVWSTYQVSDPVQLLQGDRAWSVSSQPPTNASGDDGTTSAAPMAPQYRYTRLPGEEQSEFIVQRAFVPRSSSESGTKRPELTAVMVARSDPGHYGELVLYVLPSGEVPAPDLVNADIQKQDGIAQYITPLDLQGSTVLFGEMQMVLLEKTILYVRPLYVKADGTTGVPELNRVIAVNGDRIEMGLTLDDAVSKLAIDIGEAPSPTDDSGDDAADDPSDDSADAPTPTPTPRPNTEFEDMSVAELVASADELLARADTAEQNGNADEAAELRADAQAALQRLAELLGFPITPSGNDSGEA